MKEIEQPVIVLDPEKHLSWDYLPRIRCEWVRAVAPQLGLDAELWVLGEVLHSITGDDGGTLYMVEHNREAEGRKAQLIERLEWEIDMPETPENIRVELQKTLEQIKTQNWLNTSEFEKGKNQWISTRKFVEKEINTNPHYQNAKNYYIELDEVLAPYWRKFMDQFESYF